MRLRIVGLILTFLAIAVLSGLAVHYLLSITTTPAPAVATAPPPVPGAIPAPSPAPTPDSLFGQIFGSTPPPPEVREHWTIAALRILMRLALAAGLASMLAFRPRRNLPLFQRSPFVAQTQILLAVVASALMMIVGDNAARAFGIFAAASLVRFRTNISDPKEITVLLIGLAIGLATGVGRFELAIALTLFMFLVLFLLEYFEPDQLIRPMELRVTTRNVEVTQGILQRILVRHKLGSEVREVRHEDEIDPLGRIVYQVNVRANLSTDKLSDELLRADANDLDAVEWHITKDNSYIYK